MDNTELTREDLAEAEALLSELVSPADSHNGPAAVLALAFRKLREEHGKRVTQLLEANSAELEKRRAAERIAKESDDGLRVWMKCYSEMVDKLRHAVSLTDIERSPLADITDCVDELATRYIELREPDRRGKRCTS